MALQTAFPTPLPTSYAVIAGLNLDYVAQRGRLIVDVYQDKTAHDSGAMPVKRITYQIEPTAQPNGFPSFSDFINLPVPVNVASGPTVPGTTTDWEVDQANYYALLLTLPEFQGATVVP